MPRHLLKPETRNQKQLPRQSKPNPTHPDTRSSITAILNCPRRHPYSAASSRQSASRSPTRPSLVTCSPHYLPPTLPTLSFASAPNCIQTQPVIQPELGICLTSALISTALPRHHLVLTVQLYTSIGPSYKAGRGGRPGSGVSQSHSQSICRHQAHRNGLCAALQAQSLGRHLMFPCAPYRPPLAWQEASSLAPRLPRAGPTRAARGIAAVRSDRALVNPPLIPALVRGRLYAHLHRA